MNRNLFGLCYSFWTEGPICCLYDVDYVVNRNSFDLCYSFWTDHDIVGTLLEVGFWVARNIIEQNVDNFFYDVYSQSTARLGPLSGEACPRRDDRFRYRDDVEDDEDVDRCRSKYTSGWPAHHKLYLKFQNKLLVLIQICVFHLHTGRYNAYKVM